MIEETIHGKLVAKKDGIYTIYVFQVDDSTYRMCTKLPNWGIEYNLKLNDSGFITIQNYEAGEMFFNRRTNRDEMIQFTNSYFKEFVSDNIQEEIIL